ncbi:MAG TPA: MATE family efflux transporter [Flavipsychrobacter sp.]|nr:MATE family efflux transporter [Flavipsychrobacter sp.]
MKVSISNRDIIKLAAPISLALLIPQISFLTNTAFLGRYGERELGVNGVGGIFYLMLSMIGYGLSIGLQIQMARRVGERNNDGVAKILSNGMRLSVFIALALMVLSLWLTPIIFGLSLHDSNNIYLTINYLYIRVWGLPFLLLSQLINAFFISINRSRFLIYGYSASALMNILFDYTLIFGNFGFPRMGLAGAAIASIIAEFASFIIMYGIFYFKQFYRQYPVHLYAAFDFKLSKRTFKVSVPLIVQFLFSIGGWQVFFIFVEHLGDIDLAASQILRSLFGIIGAITWAFASATSTMVSNTIGQRKQREVLGLIYKIAKLSLFFTAIVCVPLLLFPHQFLALYTNDVNLLNFAIPSMRVIVCATLIMSISTVAFNGVVGTGNTLINLTMEITSVGAYLLYCYIIIERLRSPLYVCWMSEFVYWSSLITASLIYLKSGRWKGKKI